MMDISLPGGLSVKQFRFLNHSYDHASGEAVLAYAFDDGEAFFERIRFPYHPWPSEPSRQAAFERALGLLHLIAGVSYYKACVPQLMDPGDLLLDKDLAEFLNTLYVRGLAEFAYTNNIELDSKVNFPINSAEVLTPLEVDLPERALVAMGGGKDSLVSLELLRQGGCDVQAVCVGQSKLIADTAKAAGLPLIQIERELSPALARMNEAGALNGHVPVTAINSVILLCASILYGYRWIVFSNESSAEEATLKDSAGKEINHQFSKSLEFEKGFRKIITTQVSRGIDYFSLLRSLKELAIAQKFSEMTQYHQVFSSCNRNFHRDGPRITGRWCGNCPKCRFTSLALAPFMQAEELVSFMGINLLDEAGQEEGFRALCELGIDKPFECVGSVDESRAAMLELFSRDSWKEKHIVANLGPELSLLKPPGIDVMLAARGEHCIPSIVLKHVAF
ncbi:MAG: hypothetical protein ACI9H8_001782 [Lysobacterales bacterium]|jgi:hypothetical protein